MRHMHHASYLLLTVAVAACSASETTMTTNSPASDGKGDTSAHASRYRPNPHPRKGYRIIMTLADAPGPFESVHGSAYYEASNCSYVISHVAGVRGNPDYERSIEFDKLNGTTYAGTVYIDAMLDEDYFGDGMCHWQMISMGVTLKATGLRTETRFAPSLMRAQVTAQESLTTYFQKEFYPRDTSIENFAEFGQVDRSRYGPDVADEDLFSITLTSRQAQP